MVDLVCKPDAAYRPHIAFPAASTSYNGGHPMGLDQLAELSQLWAGRPESRLRGRSWDEVVQQVRSSLLNYQEVRARICKRLWSPGIESEESISPAYVAWRAGTPNMAVVPARQAGNRFLGSLKRLQIRAQAA
jgi:hypothetical protein